MVRRYALLVWLSCFLAPFAGAATRSWTGAVNNLWSVAGNWNEGVAPADGDDLVFPNTFSPPLVNDIAGLDLGSITSTTENSYSFSGNAITLAGGISGFHGTLVFDLPITLTASQTFSRQLVLHNSVNLNGHTLTLGAPTGSTRLSGSLTGTGHVILSASASLEVTGASTFTGTLTQNGRLIANGFMSGSTMTGDGEIVGTGTIPTAIRTGGVVRPGSDEFNQNPVGGLTTIGTLTFNGGTLAIDVSGSQSDSITVNGAVALNTAALQVTLPGGLPGAGQVNVIIANDGAEAVSGTFTGLPEGASFTVSGTTFTISYAGGDGNDVTLTTQAGGPKAWTGSVNNLWSVGGNWNDGVAPVDGDDLVFPNIFAPPLVNDVAGLDLGSITSTTEGSYSFSGNAITLAEGISGFHGTLAFDLPITLAASQTFSGQLVLHDSVNLNGHTLTLGSGSIRVSGSLTGTGHVILSASASMEVTGASTFTGTLTQNGRLIANGFMSGSTMTGDGEIVGTGTIPTTIRTGGFVRPGSDEFNQNPIGGLTTIGSLTFNGGTLAIDVSGTQSDSITVNGAVALNSAALQVTLPGGLPGAGQVNVIIANDGADAVSGTFTGLPEGASFTVSGVTFTISYAGGDGNDVTLMTQAGGPKAWTGSVNNLWSAGGNWNDGVPPVDGDDLVFPNFFSPPLVNDIAGLDLGSITSTTEGSYSFSGNAITLAEGISGFHGTLAFDLPITLAASQTFSGQLVLHNSVNLNGHTLTLGSGSIRVSGSLTGTGHVILSDSASLEVTGASTFTGTLTQNGRLIANGFMSGSTMTGAGEIAGTGTIPTTIRTGGFVRPGEIVFPNNPIGGLTTVGSLTFNGGTLAIDVSGTQSDSITVNGAVALNTAALQLTLPGATPSAGQINVLIANDGTDPAGGTFTGLPEGTVFTSGGTTFRITYAGGDGNDVALTTLIATAATLTASDEQPMGGEPVTLRATVTANSGTPAGTVNFRDGGVLLATATLDGAGIATATIVLPGGTHTIVAEYVGQGTFAPSVSAPVTIESLNGAAAIPALGKLALLLLAMLLATAGAFVMR